MQGSAAYKRSPAFCHGDMSLELPAASDIWNARSPAEWRTRLLSRTQSQRGTPLTLIDIVRDPALLPCADSAYDSKLGALAAVQGMWIQVASYLDSRAIFHPHSSPMRRGPSLLWLEAQRQDLYQILQDMKKTFTRLHVLTAEAWMICEFSMMSLYASSADIQTFVGRFGQSESQATQPRLQLWLRSDEHRYAVWHAGQVLRAGASFNVSRLNGFYAIMVYEASLTLLTVSILPKCTELPSQSVFWHLEAESDPSAPLSTQAEGEYLRPFSQCVVTVNSAECRDTDEYLSKGTGSPALQIKGNTRLLSDVEPISSAMTCLFEQNHRPTAGALPPLLEELATLLKALSQTV